MKIPKKHIICLTFKWEDKTYIITKSVKDNVIYTAGDEYVLSGVTRISVLKALEEMGVKVVFESPKLSEIESADTLFISSTSMAAMPVSTLNSKPIKCDFDFVKRVTTYVRAHELD